MYDSDVAICNEALSLIGADRITSLEDDHKNARLCALLYPSSRDLVLSEHDWACARHRQSLTDVAGDIESEFDYQYQLPEDPLCLAIRGVQGAPSAVWVREGRLLHTDEESVVLVYTKRVTDARELDAWVGRAIAIRLAADLVTAMKGEGKQYQLLEAMYERARVRAQYLDERDSRPEDASSSRWIDKAWNPDA